MKSGFTAELPDSLNAQNSYCINLKITEKDIEIFIRYPSALSAAEREKVRDEIGSSIELQKLADWFRDFYDIVDSENRKSTRKPGKIKLLPIKKAVPAEKHRFVLAAMTGNKTAGGLETVATYVSEVNHTILRVLKNHSKDTIDLYVLSPHLSSDDSAILFIPEKELHMVTHPGGKLSLPYQNPWMPEDLLWQNCEILLPKVKVSLENLLQNKTIQVTDTLSVHVTDRDGKLYISTQSDSIAFSSAKLLVHRGESLLPDLHYIGEWEIGISGEELNRSTNFSFYV